MKLPVPRRRAPSLTRRAKAAATPRRVAGTLVALLPLLANAARLIASRRTPEKTPRQEGSQ